MIGLEQAELEHDDASLRKRAKQIAAQINEKYGLTQEITSKIIYRSISGDKISPNIVWLKSTGFRYQKRVNDNKELLIRKILSL